MPKQLRKKLKEDTPDRMRRRARAMVKRLKKVQRHHITYEPEWVVPIFVGEHWTITQLQRRKHVSRGFLESVEYELKRMRKGPVYDLDMPDLKKRKRRKKKC